MTEYITIHGDNWKLADIKESVEWARKQQWQKREWAARAALISKGSASDYVGQKYDPEHTKLVEDGWTHDHCEICWWSLHKADDPEHGEGYTTDGHKWVCTECFHQFLVANRIRHSCGSLCGVTLSLDSLNVMPEKHIC